MAGKKIAVVGAGVGGLAAAARLAHDGHEGEVFEKLAECGGRNHILEDKGFKFDTGPSFVLMRNFFDEVFAYCGQDIADYLDLQVLDESYTIHYGDGDSLTFYSDLEKTKAELNKIQQGGSTAFEEFLKETGRIYSKVQPFLYEDLTPLSVFNPKYWPLFFSVNPFQSFWDLAKKFFPNEKLCFAMTFEAMFLGVSPFDTPSFYSLITYADHVQKIYHPMGGMYRIPKALEQLCMNFGVEFHYEHPVCGIEPTRDKIILELDSGNILADQVVLNTDYAYAQTELLKRKIPAYKHSCSVYLLYLGLKSKVKGLAHHNLIFAKDLRKNLDEIFKHKAIPQDPSFYIYIPTMTDTTLAPPGKDIVYILVPVPNLDGSIFRKEDYNERLRGSVLNRIKGISGTDLTKLIEVEHRFYPQDFITRYNLKHASAFGLAHTLFQSAFFRPANIDRKFKKLFYVGASAQPGGGLPPVLAGSRIVADLILNEKK